MTAFIALLLAVLWAGQTGQQEAPYSNCPDNMMLRNVGYAHVSSSELMKYAKVKVQPHAPSSCRCAGTVKVQVFVEGERPFCAQALDGHPMLQKAAVEAAMQWRFKKKRPAFREDIYGEIAFDFKN